MPNYPIIGAGTQNDPYAIKLVTKKGRWIRNEQRKEMPPAQLKAAVDMMIQLYNPTFRSISATYNCFGMVFASRRTCIDPPSELDKILADDEYKEVKNKHLVNPGDVIIYRKTANGEITHAGIVLGDTLTHGSTDGSERNLLVLSQWGANGEWVHAEANVPQCFGTIREFYSERKSV
jgi:hypothetical protein